MRFLQGPCIWWWYKTKEFVLCDKPPLVSTYQLAAKFQPSTVNPCLANELVLLLIWSNWESQYPYWLVLIGLVVLIFLFEIQNPYKITSFTSPGVESLVSAPKKGTWSTGKGTKQQNAKPTVLRFFSEKLLIHLCLGNFGSIRPQSLGWCFFFFTWTLQRWSKLTCAYFFRWAAQPPTRTRLVPIKLKKMMQPMANWDGISLVKPGVGLHNLLSPNLQLGQRINKVKTQV